jgi:hypothetical protein
MMLDEPRVSMVFYLGWLDIVKKLPTKKRQLALILAILNYAFYDIEPPYLGELEDIALVSILSESRRAIRKYEAAKKNGAQGGRPPNAKPESKPESEPKLEPHIDSDIDLDISSSVPDKVVTQLDSTISNTTPQLSKYGDKQKLPTPKATCPRCGSSKLQESDYPNLMKCTDCSSSVYICPGCGGNTVHRQNEYWCLSSDTPCVECGQPPKLKPYQPSSLAEVQTQATKLGLSADKAQQFWNHYERAGWLIRGEPIVDWKMVLAEWSDREVSTNNYCSASSSFI